MISVWMVIWILFVHWFADFVCQTDWQAKNKSKNWFALTEHILVYTLIVGVCLAPFVEYFLTWSIINGVAHFWTDAVTSRISKRLWLRNEVRWFFAVVGFDQFLHYVVLFTTFVWLSQRIA